MTVKFEEVLPDIQSFQSIVWTEVASKSGSLFGNPTETPGVWADAFHKIFVSAEYGGDVVDEHVGIRILFDGNEVAFDYHLPTLAGQYKKFTDMGIIAFSDPAVHTLSLEVRALTPSQTVNVRRIRVFVEHY